ncbi:MAG: (Fe-S)-binding protein [Bacteroidota bacterium]
MKIDLFIPCFIDQFNPQTGFNMVKVLEKAGCKVNYNVEQTCCGLPAFNAGQWNEARQVGEKLLSEVTSDRNFVCASSACTAMIRNSYDLLFQNSSYHNKFRQLQKRTFELSEFLVDTMKVESVGSTFIGQVVFMDTCTALNGCGIKEQPRKLLKQIEGLEIVEIGGQNECCGFGGSFAVANPELSVQMGNKKLEAIKETRVQNIISTDYSCLIHLKSIADKKGMNLNFLHIADVLASGI